MIRRYDFMGKLFDNSRNHLDDNDDETESPSEAGVRDRRIGASRSYEFGIAELIDEWKEPELQNEDGTVGPCESPHESESSS
jgi:hypothetical protein